MRLQQPPPLHDLHAGYCPAYLAGSSPARFASFFTIHETCPADNRPEWIWLRRLAGRNTGSSATPAAVNHFRSSCSGVYIFVEISRFLFCLPVCSSTRTNDLTWNLRQKRSSLVLVPRPARFLVFFGSSPNGMFARHPVSSFSWAVTSLRQIDDSRLPGGKKYRSC